MKFLDINGLRQLLKFMDRTVSVVCSNLQYDSHDRRVVPFITNHQILNSDRTDSINVFNWFKGASEGGILEIVSTGTLGGRLFGVDDKETSIMYKMNVVSPKPPILDKCDSLPISYDLYARLIKLNGKLIVAEYVRS